MFFPFKLYDKSVYFNNETNNTKFILLNAGIVSLSSQVQIFRQGQDLIMKDVKNSSNIVLNN